MNKKLIIHLSLLACLTLYTLVAWSGSKKAAREAEKAQEEEQYEDDYITGLSSDREQTTDSMLKVGGPLLITMIYGGVLAVIYVLPMFVDKMSEELMGSSEEVEMNPLTEAKTAIAEGDYLEAIRILREVWTDDPAQRFPMVEIARLQRDKLESPAVAVSTLREALDSRDWEEEDAAFLMFRIAEIYEKDLDEKEGMIAILKKVVEDLPETRHSANASHKLRELGAI